MDRRRIRARFEERFKARIKFPVLYIWGDADDTVGLAAAEGTRDFVCGPYQFAILPGISHFAAEHATERVTELLLAHLARYPA